MKIIAHRCGTEKYPEQTMAAAEHSFILGADYVEMDIQYTADGVPVICHDPNTLRLFGKNSNISNLTITEFLALRYTSSKRYCTHSLDDVLASGIAPIVFHCKVSGLLIEDVLQHLRQFDYEDKVVMGVQAADDVKKIKSFNAAISTLAFMPSLDKCNVFMESGADIIRLWEPWVSSEYIGKIHAAGRKIWVMAGMPKPKSVGYTTEKNLRLWVDMGVDGVLIDEVGWAKRILNGI
jgi:glycerophosphoryl diester phosphodiesterase